MSAGCHCLLAHVLLLHMLSLQLAVLLQQGIQLLMGLCQSCLGSRLLLQHTTTAVRAEEHVTQEAQKDVGRPQFLPMLSLHAA